MISAVIHTYNEEKNIQRCLSSLNWVDEIVIIDMKSNDKTQELARPFKPRIYEHPYLGFADPARNFAIQKARGKWILMVDADEEIPLSLSHRLRQLISNNDINYYRLPRKNIIFDKWIKHTGWWPDYQIRFFKKGTVNWTDKVHGIPQTKGNGFNLPPQEELSIIHYNYSTIEQYMEKMNRYTTLASKELYVANVHFSPALLSTSMTKEFLTRYFAWQGYKDGLHGLVLSLLQSFTELVIYLKLWELEGFKKEQLTFLDVGKLIKKDYEEKKSWLTHLEIRSSSNILNSLFIKLKNRLF